LGYLSHYFRDHGEQSVLVKRLRHVSPKARSQTPGNIVFINTSADRNGGHVFLA
jgi:hypothetical protein